MAQNGSLREIPRLSKNPSISTTTRWQAVVNRNRSTDDFVYGVLTTRIYCRPSCPARLARRANIIFYDTPSQAEAAGFRPCKRCKPDMVNPQQQLVRKACTRIESEIKAGLKPKLQKLAEEANLTPSHFHRVFKRTLGMTPGQYVSKILESHSHQESGNDEHGAAVTAEPCDININILDPCIPGASKGVVCPDVDGLVPWNDFDFLIAAENEYNSSQGIQSLDDLLSPVVDGRNILETSDTSEDGLVDFLWEEEALQFPTESMAHMDETELLNIQPEPVV
ncbi:hypothetical protein PHISCL_07744 [Aspergillus sclerotialis]|uniref:HTH araC/xylS-type domain-containing protein n=1 Tax=Aspergillus sclerotialis TaxID=2070753 RepID=A0A3A2Z9W4_9EURO|nr:hypothetical protein PHISCL_07744 [Aspergillus sclerotialis]